MTAPVLTSRQHEILKLMAEGLTIHQIAERLFLEYNTVRTHQRLLYKLLGAHTGAAAVAAGYRLGLLQLPPDPADAELKRVRGLLRETENQLGAERRLTAKLSARLQALQIHAAICRIEATIPAQACGEYLCEKPIHDVPTGELL